MIFPEMQGKKVVDAQLDQWAQVWLKRHYRYFPNPSPLLKPDKCQQMIDHFHQLLQADYSYGGYLEDRSVLWRGNYLAEGKNYTHLGVDFNAPVGMAVAVDTHAQVVLVDDDTPLVGGWGNRVMIRLQHEEIVLIYAHLSTNVLCKVGDVFTPGIVIGYVGNPSQNGHWYPHTHVQAMTMERYRRFKEKPDELDGYGAEKDLRRLVRDFPNPMRWVRAQ